MTRVAVVTGSRADFGLLQPILRAMAPPLQPQLVVTGMHWDEEGGRTGEGVEAGNAIAARVPLQPATDGLPDLARAIGRGIADLTDAFERLRSDLVLVLGDRHEALAAAVAAVYSGRLLVHVHGGDISGGLDERARHAISKLAHVHCPATRQSADRLLRMGEPPATVHVVGAPGLDDLQDPAIPSPAEVRHRHGLPPGRFLLFVMHPDSSRPERAGHDVSVALEATLSFGLPVVAIGSNLDPGGRAANRTLREAAPRLRLHANLPRRDYLGLLRACAAVVGNSSSALIEAPSYGVPAVNVGDRQRGRQRGTNVLDAPAEQAAITAAIERALSDDAFRRQAAAGGNPYGDGRTGPRIAALLAGLDLGPALRSKPFHEDRP